MFFIDGGGWVTYIRPDKRTGNTLNWVQLSNSGDTLKIIVPSYCRKTVSGWTNPSGMVTSYNMSENEMGNRGSKSELINNFVKEQRADGSYFGLQNKLKLRCALTDCESSYLIKYPSKQHTKNFSTVAAEAKLNPWFVTGFTDAEGTFTVVIVKDSKRKVGWRVLPKYQICLHARDYVLLLHIQQYFGGIGSIHQQNTGESTNLVYYTVSNVKELTNVIIPHFLNYNLLTQKAEDFRLFKAIVDHILDKAHLTIEGLQKIFNIKASLNNGLSDVVLSALHASPEFKIIRPVYRGVVIPENISDPNWITGFVNGEGTFDVKIYTSKTKIGKAVQLRFRISQHERDIKLMELLINYLGCGQIEKHSKNPAVALVVTKFKDNTEKIIPLFEKYPLVGVKKLDFNDWCQISKLMTQGSNLTIDGLSLISSIKAGMNSSRKYL